MISNADCDCDPDSDSDTEDLSLLSAQLKVTQGSPQRRNILSRTAESRA